MIRGDKALDVMNKGFYRTTILLAALVLVLTACSSWPGPARDAIGTLRVMTFNIRYDEPADGPNAWPRRKELAAGTISFYKPHVAGLQEVLVSQLGDLEELLPEYAWVGVGRDDGKEAGEYNPIFFLKDRFRLLESSTFWLSERPDRPGVMGWDAACPRIVTWARLRDVRTGVTLFAFNTHFDHVGDRARKESASLVLKAIRRIGGGAPVVLTGDFNCTREDAAYRTLVSADGGSPLLRDARDASLRTPYGPPFSFNGFREDARSRLPIDHIFVGPSVDVLSTGILPGSREGRFVSDHNPVQAEIRLARR